jgi:hypothetical protein
MAGLLINIALVFYVYFFVEGGSTAIRQGGGWVAILNEIPQTLVTIAVAVILPYFMIWNKFKHKINVLLSAGSVMLATTLISGLVIVFSHLALTKELSIDIGWVILWFSAFYFYMLPSHTDRQ